MQKIVVSEKAIREMIREALSNNKVDEPVKVSDVVDPSAMLTDPGNEDYRPNNPIEFQVAVKALSDDLPVDKIPDIYEKLVNAANLSKKENEDKMKKGDTKVESLVRAHVRKMLRENFVTEATPAGKYSTVSKDDGTVFKKIAKIFDMSVAQASALTKHKPGEDPGISRNLPWFFAQMVTLNSKDPQEFDDRVQDAILDWLEVSERKFDILKVQADINAWFKENKPGSAEFKFQEYYYNPNLAIADLGASIEGVEPFAKYLALYKPLKLILRKKFEDVTPAKSMKDFYPENPPER